MVSMLLVVTNAANHALLDALGFETNHVEHFSDVAFALGALGVPKMFLRHYFLEKDLIIYGLIYKAGKPIP
jgi:hypothetical protein